MRTRTRFFQTGITVVMAAGGLCLAQAQDPGTNGSPPQFDTNTEPKVARAAQINLSPALAEIVRLAQSGADETVVTAYVQKAPPYTVSADEIIYLQDLGISDAILKALVEHGKSGAPGAVPPPATAPSTKAPPSVPEPTPVAPTPAPTPAPPVTPALTPPATVTEFYEPLTPYGTWVIVEPYGWCWQPTVVAVNAGWSPYCDNGNWLWSDSGWYWHSYYVTGSGNRIINQGVDRNRVESLTGTRVREVAVREMPREPARAGTVMPDRVTKVGRSDVVYRPGPKIDVPRKPAPSVFGKSDALHRQEAPIHRKSAGDADQVRPAPSVESRRPAILEPQTRQPRIEPASKVPTLPATPPPAAPPPATPPRVTAPQTTPPQVTSPHAAPPRTSQPIPARPPGQRAPKEERHESK